MQLQEDQVAGCYVPGKHTVAGIPNLYLVVRASGSRSWVYRYNLLGKNREHGLGSVKKVSLDRAVRKAGTVAERIDQGHHPLLKRGHKAPGAPKAASARFVDVHQLCLDELKAKRNTERDERQFEMYLAPLGPRHVATLAPVNFAGILAPYWDRPLGHKFCTRSATG